MLGPIRMARPVLGAQCRDGSSASGSAGMVRLLSPVFGKAYTTMKWRYSHRVILSVLSLVVAIAPSGCVAEGSEDFVDDNEEVSASEGVSEAPPMDDDLLESESASVQVQTSAYANCAATSVSWSQSRAAWNGNTATAGNYICYGDLPAANHGYIVSATLAGSDRTGSAQYTCSNGSWVRNSGYTCDGKVVNTETASGVYSTCSSADPVRSKWIGWYLADLKRCADTDGLDWWVTQYNNNADCLQSTNYNGYGSKDVCWRAQFRNAANGWSNSYSVAQSLGHIGPNDEDSFCGVTAGYPWTSVSTWGRFCKYLP